MKTSSANKVATASHCRPSNTITCHVPEVANRRHTRRSWYLQLGLTVGLALLVAGCKVTPPAPTGNPELVTFLTDSKTTKTDALLKLGQPTGRFENDGILTYRLGFDEKRKGYYVVTREGTPYGWPTWSWTRFSLVLVFDDSGILTKHSLVRVNQ